MSKTKKRSGHGLGAALQTAKKEALNPGMYFAGLIASALAAKAIDKFIPPSADEEGKINLKRFIKPVALLVTGATVAYVGRSKESIRYLGYGIATGGVVSATKVILKKDFFGGLGDAYEDQLQVMMDKIQSDPKWLAMVKQKAITNGNSAENQIMLDAQWMLDQQGTSGIGAVRRPLRRTIDAEVFREAADTEKQLIQQNSYDPDLSSEFENNISGLLNEDDDMLLGLDKVEDADYQILGLDNPSNEEIL
jgi:hypothetical protein